MKLIPAPLRSRIAGALRYRSARRIGYTKKESREIVRAFDASDYQDEVTVFGRRIRIANAPSLRYLLTEIVLEAQYRCELGTDAPIIFDCGANIGFASLFFASFGEFVGERGPQRSGSARKR